MSETGGGYPPAPPTTSGRAVAVLVLGISSLISCFIVAGIVALFLAPGAKREIETSGGRATGQDLVRVGVICSWVSIALVIVAGVVFAVLLALLVASGGEVVDIRTDRVDLRSS